MKNNKKKEMIESKVGSTLTENKKDVHTCSITGRKYEGFGNNAYPFKGRCCDYANSYYVIPARIIGICRGRARGTTCSAQIGTGCGGQMGTARSAQ